MATNSFEDFTRATDAIYKFEANFAAIRDEEHHIYTIEVMTDELKSLWAKVKETYEDCVEYARGPKMGPEVLEVAEGKYQSTLNAYARCIKTMRLKSDDISAICKAKTPAGGEEHVSSDRMYHNLPLPTCDTDIFMGDYLSWPTFRDLFTALFIRNSRLSNIERLCYLIKRTDKEAKEIVTKCPLTNAGFDIAWNKLRETYENPRMLVNNQLKNLFNLESVGKESSVALKALQRGINSFLTAMNTYDIDTENWDPIIVFICIQRLPSQTVTLWEQSIKDKTALSLWKDLDAFLTERIQTLDCIRDLTGAVNGERGAERKVKVHVSNTASHNICILCSKQNHLLRLCPRFKKLSVPDRFATVKKFHCCVNCLSRSHEVRDCKIEHRCYICDQKHHSLLHRDSRPANTTTDRNLNGQPSTTHTAIGPQMPSTSAVPHPYANHRPYHTMGADLATAQGSSGASQQMPSTSAAAYANINRQVFHIAKNSCVLLGTAMVNIVCHDTTYPVRALIDPASEASFISERLRNQLRLTSHSTNVKISGVNRDVATTARRICTITVGSPVAKGIHLETSALVLPSVSGNLPSFLCPTDMRGDLLDLQLADVNFYKSRPVDLLLGADLYPEIILGEVRRNILGSLMAQKTVFGWVLMGPVNNHNGDSVNVFSTSTTSFVEDNLNENLLKFWELEEAPKKKMLSHSDRICEEIYVKTTTRDTTGRYVVSLPFRPEFPHEVHLGNSRLNVYKQFLRIESSLSRKPDIRKLYEEVLMEYLDLGHMRPVNSFPKAITESCYLPHHPVIKPESKTTKLRVVFNASNKTSSGQSLNDCLFIGPSLQLDLVNLIVRWRLLKFVFNCDIVKMYRQIRVHPSHTPFQRILYRRADSDQVVDYELQTVTFGLNCAPYLAIRTLLQLAEDCEEKYPLAAKILRGAMYVDDVLSGAHDICSALSARDQLRDALLSAGLELRKWTSNDRLILDGLPSHHLIDAKVLTFEDASCSKTLGIFWNAQLDSFFFKVSPLEKKSAYTKREVLSTIAKFFDPVGWLSPIIITAKMMMQRIWLDNIGWDEALPSSTEADWLKFVECFNQINCMKIPRWVNYYKNSVAEIHVFSDASEKAYAGVIYLRTTAPTGEVYTHLVCAKTKVAPLKSISLPRLELCGAVLASELLKSILGEIDIPIERVYCWTDSTIVLAWLRKAPCSWTTFVANRVCRIQENTGNHNWFHVRSEDNPADLGSRGVDPLTLSTSELWWHGPSWLRLDRSNWKLNDLGSIDTDVERKSIRTHASFFSKFEDILDRFSSIDRAMRVIAYIFRFFHSTHSSHKGQFKYDSDLISNDEIAMVKLRLAIVAQKAHFSDEYRCLLEKKPLPSKSSLLTLNPMLDEQEVMRLNGRLVKAPSLSYGEQYPIILPFGCRFAKLMAEFIHKLTIHGGNQLMLRVYRCEYWVPRLRTLVRTVIRQCKRQRSCSQIMAALPTERTTIDRPFTTTGVDFAGPFDMRTYSGRSYKITKGYVCIFVCFSTRAIHLEAVSSLSTDSFLAAFNRFISRRGCPTTMFSDNGRNFVGAANDLAREFKTFILECQSRQWSTTGYPGLTWKFIPAGAPHMGGLWEAGVKSFKLHFRKEAQSCKYTFEELSTVLARIEACLNSRPLCPLPDSPTEPLALTPGHFLIGSAILAPPEPTISHGPISIVNRYRKVLAFVHVICKRWKEEYLIELHKRYKWKHPQRDVAINDLVVVKNEQLPATSWKLGLIIKIYTGSDGHVRVADVRTQNGVITRPITKLVVLTHYGVESEFFADGLLYEDEEMELAGPGSEP